MGRRPVLKRGRGSQQLNAKVPTQLAFRFNKMALQQGTGARNELISEALETFLRAREDAEVSTGVVVPMRRRELLRVQEVTTVQEAIFLVEEYAKALLEIVAMARKLRKGPKSVARSQQLDAKRRRA